MGQFEISLTPRFSEVKKGPLENRNRFNGLVNKPLKRLAHRSYAEGTPC